MDSSSLFIVPTIIDVPELIVTNEDTDYDDSSGLNGRILSSKLQFLGSALSFTVNLANLWRFPYLCYKHAGGAFLVAYTTTLLSIGIPIFMMEFAFGQYASEGPITIWRISPAFEGIGYVMCLISTLIAIHYGIINTWILHYLLASLTFGSLPWSTCDNSWNTQYCILKSDENNVTNPINSSNCSNARISDPTNSSILLVPDKNCTLNSNISSTYEFDKIINTTAEVSLPANEYFHNNVLGITNSFSQVGSLNWDFLISLMTSWLLVLIIVSKNMRPFPDHISLIGTVMPYLCLIALLTRAMTLPGSSNGISEYLSPDWNRLQNIDVWMDATTQIFFSLSPCWGGVITFASMNKFHSNFHSNTMMIMTINYVTSVLAGMVAFAIVGFVSSHSGVEFGKVIDVGIGFIFMVYTEALSELPLSNLNSIIFFAILLFIGLNSQLTVIETVITTIIDTWPHKLRYRKPLVVVVLCSTMFLISLIMSCGNGFYISELFDIFAGTYNAMIIGILELIAIAWVYGMENFMQDIDDMISAHRNLFPSRRYWYFMWRYLSPSVLFAVLLFSFTDLPTLTYRNTLLPQWTSAFGWIFTFICLFLILLMTLVRFILTPSGSFTDKLGYLCRPSEDWAPSSYVSGPKLLNTNQRISSIYEDQDQESNDSNEDLKFIDGKANYIIPEEEDDTDTGLITNETNL